MERHTVLQVYIFVAEKFAHLSTTTQHLKSVIDIKHTEARRYDYHMHRTELIQEVKSTLHGDSLRQFLSDMHIALSQCCSFREQKGTTWEHSQNGHTSASIIVSM
jgi:hypothetical protein